MKQGKIKYKDLIITYDPSRKEEVMCKDDPVIGDAVQTIIETALPAEGYDPEPANTRLEHAAEVLGGEVIQYVEYDELEEDVEY